MAADSRRKQHSNPPSFFKVIRDPSSPHLSLPNAFVRRFMERIPKNLTLVTETLGRSWRLEIEKIGEDYCFVNGWEKLVKDVQLCTRDIVLFWLLDTPAFRVVFFDANGCEKVLPFVKTNDDVDEDDDDDDVEDEEAQDADFESECHDEVKPGKNLAFEKVISMKTHKYAMPLPIKFVRASGIERLPVINLKDHEGKEWMMHLMVERYDSTKYRLGAGWSKFRSYHNLSDGDFCKFWFNKQESVLILTHLSKSQRPVTQETLKVVNEWYPIEKPCGGGSSSGGGGDGVKVKTKYEPGPEVKVVERKREWVSSEVKIDDESDRGMVGMKRKTGMSTPEKPRVSGADRVFRREQVIYF